MNILILGGIKNPPTQKDREYYDQYVSFFSKSAKTSDSDAKIYTALFDDLLILVGDGNFTIHDTRNNLDLAHYHAIFFRGDGFRNQMDILATVNEFAKQHDISTINDYSNVRDSSKLFQAVNFHTVGLPVARTLAVNPALFEHFDTVGEWHFPCIMKANHGSHGRDNYLVHSLMEAKEIAAANNKSFVLQRFVPNDGDYRVLIVGEQSLIIKRTASGESHLNNTSQGGAAEQVSIDELPPQVLNQVKDICKHYGMTIAGVDVMLDRETGEPYFLEVNAQPQLMTGAFVEEKERLIGLLLRVLAH